MTHHRIEDGSLFACDADRWLLLRLLSLAAQKHDVHIVSFCLMGNHFHLVICCPRANVSTFMHYVGSIYARTYNQRNGRRGTLFVDNFFNELITSDEQLIQTTRYVDRNPLELGIELASYPWSSFGSFVNPEELKRSAVPLRTDLPLRLLGGPANYRAYVEANLPSDEFTLEMGKRVVVYQGPTSIESVLAALRDRAISQASALYGTKPAGLRAARAAATFVALEASLALAEEVRCFFGFDSDGALNSASYRIRSRIDKDVRFASLVDSVRDLCRLEDLSEAA